MGTLRRLSASGVLKDWVAIVAATFLAFLVMSVATA